MNESSDLNRSLSAVLAFFFGCLGVHRFYAGKNKTAVLQLITLGGIGIWSLIDFIFILFGEFKDKEGKRITRW